VIEACKNGMFHIYAIEHIDEGIQIMTGMNPGSIDTKDTVHYRVYEELKRLNEKGKWLSLPQHQQ
jgi:predicted ATP-dependent protease